MGVGNYAMIKKKSKWNDVPLNHCINVSARSSSDSAQVICTVAKQREVSSSPCLGPYLGDRI